MKKATQNKFRNTQTILLGSIVLFVIFGYGINHTHAFLKSATSISAIGQDSVQSRLQLLIDSLYDDVRSYSDILTYKEELLTKTDDLKTRNLLLEDSLKKENSFSLSGICGRLANNGNENKLKEELRHIYKSIDLIETEKENVLAEIEDAHDSIVASEQRIIKTETVYKKNRNAITGEAEKYLGPGFVRVGDNRYYFYIANIETDLVRIHNNNKKNKGQAIADIRSQLKSEKAEVKMVTNGGMYTPEFGPQGLLIENSKEVGKLDTLKPDNKATLNFYIQPNGVFYIDSLGFHVTTTNEYKKSHVGGKLPSYATQSGPMLISNGRKNNKFKNRSSNVNIRSGVGIINARKIIFIISETRVNFYDFASLFDDVFNCSNALYLDGAISSMFIAEGEKGKSVHVHSDGPFGPVISVTRKIK